MEDLTAASTIDSTPEEQEYAELVRTMRGNAPVPSLKGAQAEMQCVKCNRRSWIDIPKIDMRTVQICPHPQCADGVRIITRRFKIPSLATRSQPPRKEADAGPEVYRLLLPHS